MSPHRNPGPIGFIRFRSTTVEHTRQNAACNDNQESFLIAKYDLVEHSSSLLRERHQKSARKFQNGCSALRMKNG